MSLRPLTLALVLSLAGTAAVHAADPAATPRLDQRQAQQQKRIDQGVASGSLTASEAARLQAEQDRIAAAEAKAKSDGVVTKQERVRLENRSDVASRHIARQKHDRQRVQPAG